MNFNNSKISNFVEQQLPAFINEEFPKFVEFFKEYYKSLEIQGSLLDISNNILDYLDLDNLRKSDLVKESKLKSNISDTDTVIELESVVGFPSSEGIVSINDEIIFYETVNYSENKLENCRRGYSATTELLEIGTSVTDSVASFHKTGSVVKNISDLFLFAIIKNCEEQYLDGFPYTEINSEIDIITLIKNIKDFYSHKGTKTSIEFLFRVIFNEEILVRYPKELLLKASESDWTVDDIIKVTDISGDVYDLIGQEIYQTNNYNSNESIGLVEPILINNIIGYAAGDRRIYELKLNSLDRPNFIVPSETIIKKNINDSERSIIVDSTIGFPEENGVFQIDDEIITYKSKTFNQFFDCVRGAYDTVPQSHSLNTKVYTPEYLYGYKDGIESPENLIKMRLVGMMTSTVIEDGSSYFDERDIFSVSRTGVVSDLIQYQNWVINENANTGTSSDPEINNNVKKFTSDVISVYETSNSVYIASNGIPSHPIGPFLDTSKNIGNQYLLKTIPTTKTKLTKLEPVSNKTVGIFLNGVEAFSCKSASVETFGEITSVDIINAGYEFQDGISPSFRIIGGGGTGATLSGKVVNGTLNSITVVNGGSNFTSEPELEISYGFGATATILNDNDIVEGSIRNIAVVSGGTQYTIPPDVVITDTTGRGKGAYAVATISGGTVVGINVLNGGIDYNDKNNVVVTLVSKGKGCITKVNVRKWNYDRVFRLKNNRNSSTGVWSPIVNQKCDKGNGYLFTSIDTSKGLQYGYALNPKIFRSLLNDNIQGASSNYTESTSNFTHSPILGWAYDGSPIYGPYSYSDPLDATSSIKRVTSSYRLRSTVSANRPNISLYPLGTFVEDYEYIYGLGDLDEHNGRFCYTPEYPNGVYAYFVTVDSLGEGVFPYILGTSFKYAPNVNNFDILHTQKEFNLPSDARRIRTSETPDSGFDVKLYVNSVERGSVDSYIVGDSSTNFKVGDFVFVDNKDTEGAGTIATVESLFGATVSSLTYSVSSGFTASGVTITSGLTQFAYPTDITAPGLTIPYEAYITTTTPHNLSDNDRVFISFDSSLNQLITKTLKVKISSFQTIKYNSPSTTTFLTQDILFNSTTIFVDNVAGFSENDYIKINQEIFKIVSINPNTESFVVLRGQLGTSVKLHNNTNNVSIFIRDEDFDYDISVGDAITSSTGSGVVYAIDKESKTIEIRVLSGQFLSNNTIFDNSSPQKQISISSITAKLNYWEIDPTNTGNYFIRDLNYNLVRGTRYVFDLSDSSNINTNFTFSEDITNVNEISTVTISGIPGTSGASLTIDESLFNTIDIARLYYFEKNNQVINNSSFFSINDNYFEGNKNITVVDDTTFKFSISKQLETSFYTGISYTTESKSATGKIKNILNVDGGSGFKKLPEVLGITHIELDQANFSFIISNGSITSVIVTKEGGRYSDNTILYVSSDTGINAELIPTIVNGRITDVTVSNGGSGYTEFDRIYAVDTDAEILPTSNTIGKIKTIKFADNGNQLYNDRTLSKEISLYTNILVSNVTGEFFFRIGEYLNTDNSRSILLASKKIGPRSYLLKVKIEYGDLEIGKTITGAINSTTCIIREIKQSKVFGEVSGFIAKFGYYDSDYGKISSSSQKLIDSYYYQDYSYVIRSTKSLRDYKQQVDKSVHPLGFKLFGEVAVEGSGDFIGSGTTSSANLPDDYSEYVVNIVASGITVESTVTQRRYTVTVLNKKNLSAIEGQGAALLNLNNAELSIDKIADISSQFDGEDKTFQLSSEDGSDLLSPNGEIVLLNEVFQEPSVTKNISSISYFGNVATVTTTEDHGYAYTLSGVTYPYDLYVDISDVTYSGNGFNFNDKFEVYEVDSSNTFKVLFHNPDAYLSNTDLNACADVQSTIDNLIGILNYKISNPSSSLPSKNFGIWTTSGVSTIVGANKHRDASNLINLNRTEIIESAFAVISGFTGNPNPTKCKRDIGYIVDAVVLDLFTGGNANIIDAANAYVSVSGNTYNPNTIEGEVNETVTAFSEARDLMKLAITNNLTNKDLAIFPDFIGTSGTVPSGYLTNAKVNKGQYVVNNNQIIFAEPPKQGSTFYSIFYKFANSIDQQRYTYKIKDILFDGVTKEFDLFKNDGTPLLTESDENLLVFIDGVLQYYGETYTIDRTIIPNKIVFTYAQERERSFFAYSFGKYKYLDSINSKIDGFNNTFEIFYNNESFQILNRPQLLVVLDGVVQKLNDSYTLNQNILTFKETPTRGKICKLLYFYGKTFEKTISIYNGKVFEPIIDIGEVTPEGCKVLFKDPYRNYDYIKEGDFIKIEGETPKEIISINSTAVKYSDNIEYISFIYNDSSPSRGRNAVASAIISGVTSGVTDVVISNPGEDYDVAPIILFKTDCNNPGSGAKAEAILRNGQIIDINVLNPGSGYTEAPEVVFAKRYEIIKNQYPIYNFTERSVNISHTINPPFSLWSDITIIDSTFPSGVIDLGYIPTIVVTVNGLSTFPTIITTTVPSAHTVQTTETNRFFNIEISPLVTDAAQISVSKEIDLIIPTTIASSQVTVDKEIVLNKDSGVVDDVYDYNNLYTNSPLALNPKLGLRLRNFEENKFKYEPFNPNGNYDIGSSMTIEAISRYMPNLTIQHFTDRINSVKADLNDPEFNFGLEAYVSFGLTLASNITSSGTTILVSGSTAYLPTISGYIQFGDELVQYATISGDTLLNCTRGALGTTPTSHTAGTYIRNAWRG